MKSRRVPGTLVLALLLTLAAGVSFAQTGDGFDLTWHVMAGGGAGGPLSGDGFQLRSTASQTAIGPAAGATFDLGQGYWYGIEQQAYIYLPLVYRNHGP